MFLFVCESFFRITMCKGAVYIIFTISFCKMFALYGFVHNIIAHLFIQMYVFKTMSKSTLITFRAFVIFKIVA